MEMKIFEDKPLKADDYKKCNKFSRCYIMVHWPLEELSKKCSKTYLKKPFMNIDKEKEEILQEYKKIMNYSVDYEDTKKLKNRVIHKMKKLGIEVPQSKKEMSDIQK